MKPFKLTDFRNLLVLLILCGLKTQAQNDTSGVADRSATLLQFLPQYQTAKDRTNDSLIEKRLIDLALSQPQVHAASTQTKILDYQLKKQRNSWLNLLSLSSSLTDQTFATHPNNGGYTYPKYIVGVSIPLGLIASSTTDIKITKESQSIAKDQEAELRKNIIAQVSTNYAQYRAYAKLLAIEYQVIDDQQAAFIQVQQNFKAGRTTVDTYNTASQKYNDEVAKAINLQLSQDLVKVQLEKLIGRKMEDIFK